MKKILLFIGLILFGLANAQNELSKCKFNYELELEKKLENKQKNISGRSYSYFIFNITMGFITYLLPIVKS